MAAPALSMCMMEIFYNIPKEILDLAFKPAENFLSLDECILQQIMYGRVLNDVNLLMGKKKRIALLSEWRLDVALSNVATLSGSMYDAGFYRIPPEVRENRQISTIQTISFNYSNALPINGDVLGNVAGTGNTVLSLASAALGSRTYANYPFMPQLTLQSGNIVRCYPEMYSDGLVVEMMLEYDNEFTNANQGVIYHLKRLALCAAKQYIYNELLIKIDTAEIIAGMPIGTIKDKVLSYESAEAEYHELLMNVRGASLMDPEVFQELASMML